MKNRTLPDGWWWEACKHCGLPTMVSESGSVYGGSIGHGCVRCVLRVAEERGVREAITEGMRALSAPSGRPADE